MNSGCSGAIGSYADAGTYMTFRLQHGDTTEPYAPVSSLWRIVIADLGNENADRFTCH